MSASSCQLLKDVRGVMTGDPKIVSDPVKLDKLGFDECMEMTVLGAGVLQARSVEMAARYNIPLYVGSSFVDEEGTWVMNVPVTEGLVVKAVVHDDKSAKVVLLGVPDIPGIAARLFENLAKKGIGAEMIIQNNMRGGVNDIGFLVKKASLEEAGNVCRRLCREIDAQGVSFDPEIARISIVGAGIANHPEVPSKMFTILADAGINIEMIASTSMAVTCIVGSARAADAVRELHDHFINKEAF